MSRLVTFGCSHAYGLELDDCLTIDHPPSKLGFSTNLAKMLNREELNRSDTGAGCRQIAATVLDTEFRSTDIVVINWSNISRRGIWNGVHWEQLASWNTERSWKKYYAKYHYTSDDLLDFFMNVNLANLFLASRVEKVVNSVQRDSCNATTYPVSWNSVNFDIVFHSTEFYYKELKGGHPDQKTHGLFAERLFKLINE
jgi:hypothetical protein